MTVLSSMAYHQMPAWSLALLPLSKRLHSIYVLRCFNDPVAMLFLYAAVLASTYKKWTPTALLFSFVDSLLPLNGTHSAHPSRIVLLHSAALSIKMNILYFLPAFVYLCTLDQGFLGACRHLATVVLSQILISLPFTTRNAHSYALNAYNFQRAFLYEWTVNWRFLSSDVFLSPRFWLALLLAHIALLVNFFRKWCEPHGGAFRVLVRTFGGLGLPAALSRDRVNASCQFCLVFFIAHLFLFLDSSLFPARKQTWPVYGSLPTSLASYALALCTTNSTVGTPGRPSSSQSSLRTLSSSSKSLTRVPVESFCSTLMAVSFCFVQVGPAGRARIQLERLSIHRNFFIHSVHCTCVVAVWDSCL